MKYSAPFRRNQKTNSLFSKALLATATVFILFVGNTKLAFADETKDFYINLFKKSVPLSDTEPKDFPTETSIAKIYGQNPVSATNSDLKTINVNWWVVMDSNIHDTQYYFKHIADTNVSILGGGDHFDQNDGTFLVKIDYKDPQGNTGSSLHGFSSSYGIDRKIHSDILKKNSDTDTTNDTPYKVVHFVIADKGIASSESGGGSIWRNEEIINRQNLRTSWDLEKPVPLGSTVTASIWYCADQSTYNSSTDPDNIQEFKDANGKYICNGGAFGGMHSFFKIAENTTTFPASIEDLNAAATEIGPEKGATTASTVTGNDGSNLPECGIVQGSILGCVAQIVYGLIFKPISILAALFGKLFDFFIGYSISDESYRMAFAVRGWQLVRDISNIFFIIILVWTGFSAVFGFGKLSMKQIVPALIINAIIINFSLFATRAVIDVSNVFSRVFYSRIYVCDGPCVDTSPADGVYDNLKRDSITGYWPLSEKIVSTFNPQKILQPKTASPYLLYAGDKTTNTSERDASTIDANLNGQTASSALDLQSKAASSGSLSVSSSEYAAYFIIVTLIGAAIMFAILKMFWGVAFMFLGRVIGLYVTMIFAPFAFLSRDIPLLSKIEKLNWSAWTGELTKYALLAPIFIFYLYIIYAFLSTDLLSEFGLQSGGYSFFENVLYITIPMLIIYFLIDYGKELAKKYAGDIGNKVQEYGQKLGGFAAGVATGTAGILGRNVIGGGAALANKSRFAERLRERAAKSKWNVGSRVLLKTFNAGEKASFDARKSTIGGKFFSELGVNADQKSLNALSALGVGFGTSVTEGGYKGKGERRQKEMEEEVELYKTKRSDKQIEKDYEEENKKRREENEEKIKEHENKKSEYEDARTQAIDEQIAKDKGMTLAQVQSVKTVTPTFYKQYADAALQNPDLLSRLNKLEKPEDPKLKNEIKKAADVNNMHRETFQTRLKEGSLLGKWTDDLEKYIDENAGFKKIGGQIAAGILGTLGNTTAEITKHEADKKTAKKLSELNKIQESLSGIERVITKGFQDLVALEKFQSDPVFTNLSEEERKKIINGEKSMYDILSEQQKEDVDNARKLIEKNKEKFEQYAELVKSREANKYDKKDLTERKKKAQEAWAKNPSESTRQAFFDILREMHENRKNDDIWRNYNKYVEEQKKKMDGDKK